MILRRIKPARARRLIQELDSYQQSLYPPESNHLDAISELSSPNVIMLGCFIAGRLCAIGAVKLIADYGEIKRMYVPAPHRGKGLARFLVHGLESLATDHGCACTRLETGIYQREAVRLYEKLGYSRRKAFGDYRDDPLSVFMEKRLHPPATMPAQ